MNKIDAIRFKKHLSYGKIAKESNLTSSYISLLAKGKRTNPSLDVMRKVSNALGEPVARVFQIN